MSFHNHIFFGMPQNWCWSLYDSRWLPSVAIPEIQKKWKLFLQDVSGYMKRNIKAKWVQWQVWWDFFLQKLFLRDSWYKQKKHKRLIHTLFEPLFKRLSPKQSFPCKNNNETIKTKKRKNNQTKQKENRLVI